MTRIDVTAATFSAPLRALLLAASLVAVTIGMMPAPALGASRIKDIADFEGVRENMLVGYGLVVVSWLVAA